MKARPRAPLSEGGRRRDPEWRPRLSKWRGAHRPSECALAPVPCRWCAPCRGQLASEIHRTGWRPNSVDAAGQVLIRRQLKRRAVLAFFQKLPVYLVGIEACASSHYWSRELQALGHSVLQLLKEDHDGTGTARDGGRPMSDMRRRE